MKIAEASLTLDSDSLPAVLQCASVEIGVGDDLKSRSYISNRVVNMPNPSFYLIQAPAYDVPSFQRISALRTSRNF